MKHRLTPIVSTIFALTLFLPSAVLADPYEKFGRMILILEEHGEYAEAAELQAALDSAPEAQFRAVASQVDLDQLLSTFEDTFRTATTVQRLSREMSEREGLETPAASHVRDQVLSGWDEVDLPSKDTFCPSYPAYDSKPAQLNAEWADSIIALTALRTTFLVAEAIVAAATGACNEVVVVLGEGGNVAAGCTPFYVAWAIAKAAYTVARGVADAAGAAVRTGEYCNSRLTGLYVTTSYKRLESIKNDLDTSVSAIESILAADLIVLEGKIQELRDDVDRFRVDVDTRLTRMEDKLDLVLQVLLENNLARDSGGRTSVDYTRRLAAVCQAAQDAIDDAEAEGYAVTPKAKAKVDEGTRKMPVNPKQAFDACRAAYRLATDKSTRME